MKIDKKLYKILIKKYQNKLEISTKNTDWQKCLYTPKLKEMDKAIAILNNDDMIEIYAKSKRYILRLTENTPNNIRKECEEYYRGFK